MTDSNTRSGFDELHAALSARVKRGELPGLVTLVARGDQVQVDCLGVTALGGAEPMRCDMLFRIASLTKPILAVATLMLVEDGKFGLADPVDRWLPELANRRVLRRLDGPLDETLPAQRPITVDDLLTLRLGFGLVIDPTLQDPLPIIEAAEALQLVLGQPDPRTPHSPDEWIRRFGTLPLMYQPGQRWLYNVGSLVLGVLLARVAGEPLEELFRRRIFEPLGMDQTGFWLPAELTRNLPSYYMTDPATGQLQLRPVSSPEEWSKPPVFPSGAGGLVSTVDDFLAFARLLLNQGEHRGKRLLSAPAVELMTTNHLNAEQMATAGPILGGRGWGFGVGVMTQPDTDWPVPGRYGWAGGYGTAWFNDPHRSVVAIAMTQVSDFLWNGGLDEFNRLVALV
jgi:CubicO group peptidase (beta-lactamase class C family)